MHSIFLISDFQDQSFQIGLLKASLLKPIPNSQFIDVTHAIKLNNTIEASFVGRTLITELPEQSICLFAVGQTNSWVAYLHQTSLILCPNNGLLSMIFPDLNHKSIVIFKQGNLEALVLEWADTKTIAQELPLEQLEIRYNKKPQFNEQICIAECAYIDGNGNCYFNVNEAELNAFLKQRPFSIKIQHYNGQLFYKIHKQVNDVVSGDALFRFDHLGHLLFQVNQGSAKQLFRIKEDTKIIIEIQ